jgi:hypothetical protein
MCAKLNTIELPLTGSGACRSGTMSALGQKQTFVMQNAMSVLAPKADMCGASGHVRFVPEADIGQWVLHIGFGSYAA